MKKICVAKIIGVHGLKGEIKIKIFTENQNDIYGFEYLSDAQGEQYTITKKFTKKNFHVVMINNIFSRNQAESLIGKELFINRSAFKDLQDSQFYYEDLIGLDVLTPENEKIGQVAAIYNFGAGDIIEINFIKPNKNNLFSFTEENFPEINVNENYMIFKIYNNNL